MDEGLMGNLNQVIAFCLGILSLDTTGPIQVSFFHVDNWIEYAQVKQK